MKALFTLSGLGSANQGAKEDGADTQVSPIETTGGSEFMCRGDLEEDDDGNDSDSSSSGSIESRERPYPMINYRSLYVFHQLTPPRNFAIQLYSSSWFERISMAVILVNCVTLGMFRPCEDRDHCASRRCHVLEFLDLCISIFFMVEMAIKVLALGCFGEYGYFKDTWNKLDAFIVFSSILEYTINLESVSISAVRTVRVLRPLRAINRVPSLRILVMLLLDTLPMLGNVLMLCFFVFFIFGIIAVQLWAGNLRNRCYLNTTAIGDITIAENFSLPEYYETGKYPGYGLFICSQNKGGTFHCGDLPRWNYGSRYCEASFESANVSKLSDEVMDDYCINLSQYYTTCKTEGPNPFQGAITFDNILLAWVAIFQIISLEGWADIMYIVQDSHSFYDFFYFVLLIVIGAFFMLNLCLVVIATQFSETKRRESRLITEQRMQKSRTSNSTMSSSFQGPEIGAGCYDEIVALIGHTFRKAVRHAERFLSTIVGRHKASVIPASRNKSLCLSLDRSSSHNLYHKDLFVAKSSPCTSYSLNNIQANVNLASPELTKNAASVVTGSQPLPDPTAENAQTSSFSSKSSTFQDLRIAAARIPLASQDNLTDFESSLVATPVLRSRNTSPGTRKSASRANSGNINGSKMSLQSSINGFNGSIRRKVPKSFSYNSDFLSDPAEEDDLYKQIREAPASNTTEPFEPEDDDDDDDKEEAQQEWKFSDVSLPTHRSSSFEQCYHRIREFVDSDYFMYGIFICILLNTMSMAVEFHQQPELLTNIVETSNLIFSLIFALEMFIKISVHGVFGYLKNGYNLFDGFIVIISLIELFGGQEDENGSSSSASGLSVLRTFRLLRVLKLVRFMPALRRQLLVMLKTMDNVATFFGLLMLFMFIFSILGMHLFGCKFCKYDEEAKETVCDRKNFDSLLWAVITVFQILTQEAWYLVLYNGMSFTHPAAAIYFVALMTFGNYILFNLLVAILVEGFSTDDEKKSRASSFAGAKQLGLSSDKIDESPSEFHKEGDPNVDCGSIMHNEGGHFQEVGGRLRAPPVTPVSARTNEDASSLASRNALVPPTIIQTAATPPSIYRSIASDVDFHVDSCNLPDEDDIDDNKLGEDRRCLESRNSKITNQSFLSVPEERRGSSPRVAVMCRPYSADYENTYTCNDTIPNLRFKRGSITETSPNLCRVLYDYRLENSAYQVTYKLPPAVERRLSFAMQQHIKSLSIPRNSMGSNASFNSVPQNAIISCSDEEKRRSSSISTQPPPIQPVQHEQPKTEVRKLSSISYTKYQEAFGQPLFITPPELVAHLEKAQKESRRSLTYKLSQLNPCFFDREEYSLYLFSPENEFRKRLVQLIGHSCFDYFILMFILANCAAMALERPTLPSDGPLRKSLDIADLVFTIVFTIEMALKVMAKGLFIGKDSYVKSGWNAMDGILVCISLVDLVFSAVTSKENKIFGVLRVFRLLRTLRPLRVISRAPGLKLVVQTLLSSLRPIGNIVLICCTFFIIFGILGVQLFKGTFYHCTGPDISLVTNKTECLTKHPDNQWLNKKYNFDNLPQALMSLFVLSSKDGWINIMYSGLDAVGVDKQPIKNFNEWRILYFISFLLLVGFFVLNMFVGVVVENFHKVRAAQQAEEAAYKARILAHKIAKKKRKAMRAPYHTNYSPMRLFIHNLVMSAYFDLAIAVVIIINVITMSIEHYNMPVEMIHALKIFNYFFTAVFIMESTMKIYALGFFRFIKKRWNKLDLVIVLLSVVGIALEEADTKFLPINPTIIRVMRVFRIARVFKLLKMAKGVRQLLDTVMQALPQVGNLGLLFFLMFFIFAALGVELFGRIECNENRSCEGLSRHASFQNFGIAYLTLFRIATGDNWNGIMKDTLSTDCDASEHCTKNCCVSMVIAPIYFVVFVLMAQFVLVNVVVAVLMKHLEENTANKSCNEDDDDDEESHKQNEENVDKELLMEYMQKLEAKEKRREDKKRLQQEKKERKRLQKKGLEVSLQEIEKQTTTTNNVLCGSGEASGGNKRIAPQPLSITNRQNDGRPVSIVKPMIEGRPVSCSISSGTCSPGVVSSKSDKHNSSSIASLHDAGVMTSLHGTPSMGRREQNSAAQLSRMSSLPISSNRPRDPDRDSDSLATASPRGSNYSVNVNMLTRAGSEDKSTQTFECRMNEGRDISTITAPDQECDDVTTTPMRARKANNHRPPLVNSPCSVVLHKISLPSLEEAGDDVNSEEELETPSPKSNSSQRKPTCSPSATATAKTSDGGSNGGNGRPKSLKITHQTTQQRRTLMGLRRQQRVEEFQDEGESSSCAESGMFDDPMQNRRRQNASPNLSRSLTIGGESNPRLQKNTLSADYQPLLRGQATNNKSRPKAVTRSNTLSTRRDPVRMDSLEVPSFHPGIAGPRTRYARNPNQVDNVEVEIMPLNASQRGTGHPQEASSSKFLRNRATRRRNEFSKSTPSASLDQSYMPLKATSTSQSNRGQLSAQPSMYNIDMTSYLDKGVNTNETRATLSPAISISYPDSSSFNKHQTLTRLSPPWAKQASDESQHSGPRQKKENGEEVTPDEHLSSPEMPRRKISDQPRPSSSANVQQSRPKFKVNPKTDVPKLRRVPTMWTDTHMEPLLLSDTRKLFASDPHLKQSPETSHKIIQPNLSNEVGATSKQSQPISSNDLKASIGEVTSSSTDNFDSKNLGAAFKESESGGLQSTSIKFQKSTDVDTNFSEV